MTPFGYIFGAYCWLKNYVVTFIYLYLIPSVKTLGKKRNFKACEFDLARYGRKSIKAMGFDVELLNPHDVDLTENFVMVSNHRSWFDQIAMLASYPSGIHFLAQEEYFKIPILGRCMKNFEMIPVTKKKLDQKANSTLDKCLKQNENVCFFIEGTRGQGRDLLPFKKGAFYHAIEHKKRILPLYILGSERCSSKSRHLFDIRPGSITIVIGKPRIFSKDNFKSQFEEFESAYRRVHNQLYLEHEIFQSDQHLLTKLEPTTLSYT